jgi:hypothetical protein
MVAHPLARESAHYGPIRCIVAAAGRVWTSGGSSAFATFKEWTQTGIHVEQHSMRSMGERYRAVQRRCWAGALSLLLGIGVAFKWHWLGSVSCWSHSVRLLLAHHRPAGMLGLVLGLPAVSAASRSVCHGG